MRFWAITILSVFFLTACQAPVLKPFTVKNYHDEAPIQLRVSEIQIDNQMTVYSELPHIEKRMPVSPAVALQDWIRNRFVAANPTGHDVARFVIREASMVQKTKPSGSWFVLDNTVYTLTYKIDVLYLRNGRQIASQSVAGWEKQGLPKKSSSLAEKEEVWQKMLNTMVQKTNDKIISDLPHEICLNECP